MSSIPSQNALNMDLWPKAKFETDVVTPVSILRRQAARLGEKTQQLVTAEVTTTTFGERLEHHFRLVVPPLDNYKYQLFSVAHKVDQLYPVSGYFLDATPRRMEDEADFIGWLREVLSSELTEQKVDALMAQAKG